MKAIGKVLAAITIGGVILCAGQNVLGKNAVLGGGPYKISPYDGMKLDEGFENLYLSKYNPNERKWSQPEKLSVNESVTNKVSQKINFIIKEENGNSDIFFSELVGSNWSPPQRFSTSINSDFSETNACLSSDGSVLYFSSNRPGGFGGFDIYKSERNEDGTWGPAVNLGKSINTAKDEETPYLLSDDLTLYFSSQGHGSLGGFDVFVATLNDDGFWGKPENLGSPINSDQNDLFFSLSDDENQIYISRY